MKLISRIFRKSPEPEENEIIPAEVNQLEDTLFSSKTISDNPINTLDDDTLGRAPAAKSFAQQVLSLDTRIGNVVGVLGAWGSGKTSYINLARKEFDSAGVYVLDFNPWMFSGAEQLVESFFMELAAQLEIRPDFSQLGKALEEYGQLFSGMKWLPFIGSWMERGSDSMVTLSQILQQKKEGVGNKRLKVEKALIKLNKKIVIVIDDIDRLSASEIRDIFKLVRLTANFPNVIYIVAFDRVRVEEALSEEGIPGRDYLEKIIQVTVDLPTIPFQVLNRQILSAINDSLNGIEKTGPFSEYLWPDIFLEIIRPLIRNMRDVRRYSIAVRGTVSALNGQVALTDVLALEAVRIFLPDVFRHMHQAIEALTTTAGMHNGVHDSQFKMQIDNLIKAAEQYEEVIRDMISRLFPAAQRHISNNHYGPEWKSQWLRDRRVSHEDVLRLYFERSVGEGLMAFINAEEAWMHIADHDILYGYLRSIDANRLQDVISSLEVFEDQFATKDIIPATIVLLNLLPDIPERQRGMFDIDTSTVVVRVIYRLIRSLKEPNAVESAVKQILPQLKTLSSKLELINIIGYRQGIGHKLVSESVANKFETAWHDEVRTSKLEDLLNENEILSILSLVKKETEEQGDTFVIHDSPDLTLAILQDAQSEVASQAMGNRSVKRLPRLAWDRLLKLYEDEVTLKDRIEKLKLTEPKDVNHLLELVDKYLSGWRPREWE